MWAYVILAIFVTQYNISKTLYVFKYLKLFIDQSKIIMTLMSTLNSCDPV